MSDLENLKALAIKIVNRTADHTDITRFDTLKKILGMSTAEVMALLREGAL